MQGKVLDEALQPSLLDRLTDENPEAPRGVDKHHTLTFRHFLDIIQRDLSWLLETTNLRPPIDREKFPHISSSVLNYGIDDLTGGFMQKKSPEMICSIIREAIISFEPRILSETLEISSNHEDNLSGNKYSFDISGQVWAHPIPLEIRLRSIVDNQTSQIIVQKV